MDRFYRKRKGFLKEAEILQREQEINLYTQYRDTAIQVAEDFQVLEAVRSFLRSNDSIRPALERRRAPANSRRIHECVDASPNLSPAASSRARERRRDGEGVDGVLHGVARARERGCSGAPVRFRTSRRACLGARLAIPTSRVSVKRECAAGNSRRASSVPKFQRGVSPAVFPCNHLWIYVRQLRPQLPEPAARQDQDGQVARGQRFLASPSIALSKESEIPLRVLPSTFTTLPLIFDIALR